MYLYNYTTQTYLHAMCAYPLLRGGHVIRRDSNSNGTSYAHYPSIYQPSFGSGFGLAHDVQLDTP